jgi:hypothetical protein
MEVQRALMRKWIVIGLLALAVIGVVAFVLTRPKEGTLRYHLSEYLTLQRQISQGTPMERTRNIVNRMFGRRGYVGLSVDHFARVEEHRKALIDLGYLEQREFVLSNRPANQVISEHNTLIAADRRWQGYRREFLQVTLRGTNVIVIVARREDMPVSAEAIRKADVP